MLLRRFSDHMSDQNWFAVTLDIIVVIAGIFLGMQIDDWNESRKDAELARHYLDRLASELEISVTSHNEKTDDEKAETTAVFEAVDMLVEGKLSDETKKDFLDKFNSSFEVGDIGSKPVALRQLVDDGKVDLISSLPMQEAVIRFNQQFEDAKNQNDTNVNFFTDFSRSVIKVLDFGPTTAGMPLLTSNEEMMGNRDFIGGLRGIAFMKNSQNSLSADLNENRRHLLETIKYYLETGEVVSKPAAQKNPAE